MGQLVEETEIWSFDIFSVNVLQAIPPFAKGATDTLNEITVPGLAALNKSSEKGVDNP